MIEDQKNYEKEKDAVRVCNDRLVELFTDGAPQFPVPRLSPQEAKVAAAQVIMAIMTCGVTVSWLTLEKVRVAVPIRPGLNVSIEFDGPPLKPDVHKAMRHLDLIAESLATRSRDVECEV